MKRITVKIIPTYQCNQCCQYCDEPKDIPYTFAAKAFYRVIDYLERIPGIRINIDIEGGGEPLLCPELFDFINYKEHGTTIFTNGTLLTPALVEKCHEFVVFRVSLDGIKEVHDKYRKMKDNQSSYDATMAGINILQKHKRQFFIGSVIDIMTARRLQESYELIDTIKPFKWSITPKMVKDDYSVTQAIINYAAPIVAGLNGATPIDFYNISNGADDPNGNLEILIKDKIQIHQSGYATKNLREYAVEDLSLFIKELKEYV